MMQRGPMPTWLVIISGAVLIFGVVGVYRAIEDRKMERERVQPPVPGARYSASRPSPPPVPATPPLEVGAWTWSVEHDYATVEGEVTNLSSRPLANVEAVASFRDSAGTFITSNDALIEYNPIMPGQASPFKVMVKYNPLMHRAQLNFKELMGGAIDFRVKAKP